MTRSKRASTKFLVRRGPGNELLPLNDHAHQMIARAPYNETVQCEIRFLRNPKFNALYWTLISLVWENLDHVLFPEVDNFHDSLKIMAGIRTEIILPAGAEIVSTVGQVLRVGEDVAFYKPGSTDFHSMDEVAFSRYFWTCVDYIVQFWMPMAPEKLAREASRMCGIEPPQRIAD